MLKEKRNNYIRIFLRLFGLFIILYGSFNLICNNYNYNKLEETDNTNVEQYINDVKEQTNISEDVKDVSSQEQVKSNSTNYIAVLEIPKINLKKGLVDKDSDLNNVNKNIQIIKESTMPDVDKGNLILAGHSGSGYIAFFKDLNKLKIDDDLFIYYKGVKYQYVISNIYEIEKNGKALLNIDKEQTNLTLITCKSKSNKQIVIESYLINKQKY